MTDIPSGYQLSITSWENDADNYNTVTLNGLTEADVKFYVHFVRHFHGDHWQPKDIPYAFGNEDVINNPDAGLIALTAAYEHCAPTSTELLSDVEACIREGSDGDVVYELIGIWGEGDLYRVFDDFKVHLVRTPCPDCTEDFTPAKGA